MGINISGLGAANGIGFKSKVSGGRYLPPDLKARLVSVTSCYGKKNTDSDKDILKDKTGQGNDLIVYNGTFDNIKDGYDAPFFSFMNPALTVDTKFVTYIDEVTLKSISPDINRVILYTNPAKYKKRIPSFIINVNCSKSCRYYYIDKNKPNVRTVFNLQQGVNAVPESYADLYSGTEDEGAVNSIGFALDEGATLEVKQLSRYTGGLLLSGIYGNGTVIKSVKPFREMIGNDADSVTIVSMITQLELSSSAKGTLFNSIRNDSTRFVYNTYINTDLDKTGIVGIYTELPTPSNKGLINILGDKNDYNTNIADALTSDMNFYIQGYIYNNIVSEVSRAVFYFNMIIKGKATIDEINQVIEYFNLDRPGVVVKPDILYDIKRQGITNDNHAEFEDKLKDFIYGFDMQMYNMNWKGNSGINKYNEVFDKKWLIHRIQTGIIKDNTSIRIIGKLTNDYLLYHIRSVSNNAFRIKVTGIKNTIKYTYIVNSDNNETLYINSDGIYDLPASNSLEGNTSSIGFYLGSIRDIDLDWTGFSIEIIPDNEGALTLNGINNFGKVTNVPVWKDYTIASLRKWLSNTNGETGSILSKSIQGQDGAFIFEQTLSLTSKWTSTYSFGLATNILSNSKLNEKSLTYQTKYTYGINEQVLQVGTGLDTSRMWLGTIRDGDNRFSYISIWSAMLFRYTMSKFLLERQLKKYKIGSFYDKGMVIWRPEVTSNNSNYVFTPRIRMSDGTIKALVNGEYYNPTDANLVMDITVISVNEVTDLTINKQSYKPVQYPTYWRVEIPFPTKSPQRISITIEEYVRYESIVQPYPIMFKLVDKDTNKEYTWGDKVKVGSTIKVNSITYNHQALWSIYGYLIGGDPKTYSYNEIINKDIVVTKPLSFSCNKKWLLSTAEPLFVYDPAIFTNSAIKALGYLPDISGQNRHLKLYNFSYEGMSGKDGYPVVFGKNKTWENIRPENDNWKYGLSSTGITIYKALDTTPLLYTIIRESGGTIKPISIPSFKINIKNLQDGESIRYHYFSIDNPSTYSNVIITKNGKHELPASVPLQSDSTISDVYIGFQIILNNNESVKGLVIEILPDYKDSLYFNGITNTASVLNLDHGGKCLVTKINYKFNQESICIYDQRKNTLEENNKKFALLATQLTDIAYGSRLEGNTYINNVLNNYVRSSELENVEHVATLVSSVVEDSNTKAPLFGRANTDQNYAQFAMYRTILLPEVPNAADRAILNKWCGIPTGYLPKPEYYWDVTGKSNSDTATRNIIKNLGTAKPVASTSYPTDFTSWISNPEYIYVNSSSNVDIRSGDRLSSSVYEGNFLTNQIVPAMQVVVTLLNGEYDTFRYRYVDEEGAYQQIYVRDLVLNEPVTIDLPKNNNNNTNTGFILEANNPNAVINVTLVAQEIFDEDAYSLQNKNVAYEGMSGYNGYPVVFGANKTWETYATYNFTSTINDNKLHITKVLNSNGLIFSYVKRNDELLNIKEIPSFNIKVTGLEGESKLQYFYLSEENAANITILTLENGIHKVPKSLIPTDALPNSTWIGFKITSIQEGVSNFDCDITLEILPDYYGLCLDGITNYIECANIPAFTDYTYILMRQILSNSVVNSLTMHKGKLKTNAGAFTSDYVISNEGGVKNEFAFHSFGVANVILRSSVANKVIWANTTSVNGIAGKRGTNTDDESITIAKWGTHYRKMAFYKLMLWSKSINNTYHINMLRNLINNGGIIDLNDSIFDQTSNE